MTSEMELHTKKEQIRNNQHTPDFVARIVKEMLSEKEPMEMKRMLTEVFFYYIVNAELDQEYRVKYHNALLMLNEHFDRLDLINREQLNEWCEQMELKQLPEVL